MQYQSNLGGGWGDVALVDQCLITSAVSARSNLEKSDQTLHSA